MPSAGQKLDALIALAQREMQAGRLTEATAAYRKIVTLRPNMPEAHNDLGILLAQQGKLDEAVRPLERAIAINPNFVPAHINLGLVLKDLNQPEAAAAQFEQVLALRPDLVEAHNSLGEILLNLGRLAPAAARFEQALALQPNFAEALINLGVVLVHQNQLEPAQARFEQALALRPDLATAHNGLGNVFARQNKFAEAAAHFQRAVTLNPTFADAHNNLGNTLNHQGQFQLAQTYFEQILALKPDYLDAQINLGNVLMNQGKLTEAAARYQHVMQHWPGHLDARLSLATCYLVAADYERGWPAFEARLGLNGLLPELGIPRWNGEPLAGRTLLLLAEQGVGDTLHFLRYAGVFKGQGARIVLAVQPALGPLLADHPDVDELLLLGTAAAPRADFHLPLLSAPHALGATAAIPNRVPYLWPDAALAEKWRRELSALAGFKVGIAWQGSRGYSFDHWRSFPLTEFAPLAKLPGVRLVSLQKGFGAEQVAGVDFPVLDLSDRLDTDAGPFMDTAAVIAGLDLVVAPNTAIAHLAGALGVPTALALQYAPDWRWLQESEETPWYPTLRLYRQATFGDWPGVFQRIAQDIQTRLAKTV